MYNVDNGHFYQFVRAPGITWTDASAAANASSLYGLQGYLATLTSDAENIFAFSKTQSTGWIGASDAAVSGQWRWVDGPEAGLQFWQGEANGTSVNGQYSSWNFDEPNNSGGTEHYAQFLMSGLWNDLANESVVSGYLVEYGGSAGDPTLQLTGTALVHVANITNAPTVTSPSSPSSINTPIYSVTGSAEAGALVRVYNGDPSLPSTYILGAQQLAGGQTSYSITVPLTDNAANHFSVTATTWGADESAAAAAFTITQDAISPDVPPPPTLSTVGDTGPSSTDGFTSATRPTIEGTAEANSIVTIKDGATVLSSTVVVDGAGHWSFVPSSPFAEGNHTLIVSAIDTAGNQSTTSSGFAVTIDTTFPVVTFTNQGGATYTATQIVAGSVTDGNAIGTTVTLSEGATVLGTAVVRADSTWSTSVNLGGYGAHTITASATDLAGNTGQTPITYTVAIPYLPPAPIAVADTYSVATNRPFVVSGSGVLANDTLPHDGSLTISTVNGQATSVGHALTGQYGSLTLNADGSFRYAPDVTKAAAGLVDHFTYTETANGQTASASLDIRLTSPSTTDLNLFGSVEHNTASQAGGVYALYEAVLNRAPDPLGLEGFTTALKTGTSLVDVAHVLLTSPEYGPQAASTSVFVESLYANLLNRPADAGGLAFYTSELAHGVSQAQVAVQIATSAEGQATIKPAFDAGVFVPGASETAVARLYYGLLERAPDASGLLSFETFVKQEAATGGVPGAIHALKTVAGAMLASPEYAAIHPRSLTNAQFVDEVYTGELGRHAETAGLTYWQDALAHGFSRGDVALGIAESQEAQVHLVGQIEAGWHLGG